MLIIVAVVIVVAFALYIATYLCKTCAPTIQKFAKRVIKEVLLTLILFNELNFAYCAGIHFKYAPTADPLYLYGTISAVAALVIPILMAVALQCTE